MRRVALIIAGGSGERFWPLSTASRPKQLLRLTESGKVMLHEAVDRLHGVIEEDSVFIVTAPHLAEPITKEMPGLSGRVFAEPEKRNTGGAVTWGMGTISRLLATNDLSFAILPSDHLIRPTAAFQIKVRQAFETSETRHALVTIGIVPDRPETGYGYIHRGGAIGSDAFSVIQFIEKPPIEKAREFLRTGDYLWNSGMFFWTLDTFLSEVSSAWPDGTGTYRVVVQSLQDGDDFHASALFRSLPNLSIDHALLERSSNVAVLESNFDWDDLGSWDALARIFGRDQSGNVHVGRARALESEGCVVHNSNPAQTVSLLDVKDLIVVVTEDAVMVLPKARAQDVRMLANMHKVDDI